MADRNQSSCSGGEVSCRDALTQLWEFIDGELTADTMGQLEAHLDRCQRCYPHYDFQRAFVAFMRRQSSAPAPPGLRRRIFEMLLEEERRTA